MKDQTPLEELHLRVRKLGTQAALAEEIGIKPQYLSDIISGRRGISSRIAKALGFKKRVIFERIAKR